MVFTAAVLLLALQAPDTSVHVTFRSTALPAAKIVAELSRMSNVPLTVTPQTGSDIMVLAVEDMPLSEVMAKIALVDGAQWKPEENGFRLIADTVARGAEARAETALRTETMRKTIADRIDPTKPDPMMPTLPTGPDGKP